MNKTTEALKQPLNKPEGFLNPRCTICGRKEELRMGFCFDCANLQAMFIDRKTMHDEDISDWNKTELLAYVVRTAKGYGDTMQTGRINDTYSGGFQDAALQMQEIVQNYFKNVIKLPCPDFTFNLDK